jgi:membrane protein implicated in regulation of membrane protease activity
MSLLKWTIAALILVGMLYNFALPFTPVWLDVTVWTAVALAFVAAAVLVRRKATMGDERSSASDE